MNLLPPINFKNWIEKNRHLLEPPVGNKVVYENSDFMIMVVGGPNSRKDYHVDPVEEFFYQVEGDMVLKVIENHVLPTPPLPDATAIILSFICLSAPFCCRMVLSIAISYYLPIKVFIYSIANLYSPATNVPTIPD